MTVVRIEDCRIIKFCTPGVRRFFTKHNLDFAAFVKDGVDESQLPQDDYLVQQVVAQAKQRELLNGQQ